MNNMAIQKKLTHLLVGILMVFIVFLGSLVKVNASTANLTTETIPSTSTMVSTNQRIPLCYSSDSNKFEMSSPNHDKLAVKEVKGHYVLCVKKSDGLKEALDCSYSNNKIEHTWKNPMRLKFKKAAVINGRYIDVTVDFTEVEANKYYKTSIDGVPEDDDWVGLAVIYESGSLWISSSFLDGYGYRADKNTKIKTTITYSDTGEIVNLPFFQAIRDIDIKTNWYRECWTAGPEYKDVFYKYTTNQNVLKNRSIFSWEKGANAEKDDSLLITGGYIATNNGLFTQDFWDGNCSTGMYLYSQYSSNLLESPTKTVNKTTAKPTEELTYTIKQKIGTLYETMLEPYGMIKFTDTIPKEVSYKDGSARLYDGSGKDITNQATVSYNSSTRLLSCTLNDSWRENNANYNGQTLKLEFKAKIKPSTTTGTIKNTGNVQLKNNLTNQTNQVETKVIPWKPGDTASYVRLKIRIKDDKNELTEAHGKPTFIFKIEANGREYYRSVTFGDTEASKDWKFEKKDGYILATGKMEDLRESGEKSVLCKVTPINVLRFKVTAENMQVEYPNDDETCFTFPFVAEKTTWQYYSHNDIKVNRVSGK